MAPGEPFVTVPGVPSEISNERVRELVQALGIDPSGLQSLEFTKSAIYATVLARDSDGQWYADRQLHAPAVHRLCIKVVG